LLKIIKKYWLLLLVSGIVIILDQATKMIVRAYLPFGASWTPFELIPFFRFVHWQNTGAAFGMFQGGGLVFGILAAIVTVIIIIYFPQIPDNHVLMRIAIAMQMGGAIGNLIDRIKFGPVTDFIAVGTFPVFNIADASITVGVAVLLLALWVLERKEKGLLQGADQTQPVTPEPSIDSES
jgi:signal peptidase II